ncbi:hypothetical protein [Psychrobacillus sp. L3]|uniref:hypothetical protein n=1 Tax=Psychrobacillus sp. L3 TaxID=3236891 RepID=UPI0036F43EAB
MNTFEQKIKEYEHTGEILVELDEKISGAKSYIAALEKAKLYNQLKHDTLTEKIKDDYIEIYENFKDYVYDLHAMFEEYGEE